MVQWVVQGSVEDLGGGFELGIGVRVAVSGFAAGGEAHWVGFKVDISGCAGEFEVSFFGWDDPFAIVVLVWVPCEAKGLLYLSDVILGVLDVVVDAEVGNWVVHGVSFELGVLVLGATGGGADWVVLKIKVSVHGQSSLLWWSGNLLCSGESVV